MIDEKQKHGEGLKHILEIYYPEASVKHFSYEELIDNTYLDTFEYVLLNPLSSETNDIEVITGYLESRSIKCILLLNSQEETFFIDSFDEVTLNGIILRSNTIKSVFEGLDSIILRGQDYIDPLIAPTLLHGKKAEIKNGNESRPENLLTNREWQFLEYAARGHDNHEIGNKLFVSDKTVSQYLFRIQKKLGVSNRVGAVMKAVVNNWIDDTVYRSFYMSEES